MRTVHGYLVSNCRVCSAAEGLGLGFPYHSHHAALNTAKMYNHAERRKAWKVVILRGHFYVKEARS